MKTKEQRKEFKTLKEFAEELKEEIQTKGFMNTGVNIAFRDWIYDKIDNLYKKYSNHSPLLKEKAEVMRKNWDGIAHPTSADNQNEML